MKTFNVRYQFNVSSSVSQLYGHRKVTGNCLSNATTHILDFLEDVFNDDINGFKVLSYEVSESINLKGESLCN